MASEVHLAIEARFRLPKGMHRKREPLSWPGYKHGVPDWDNIGKIVGDAGNGVIWKDDAWIVEATVTKVYAPQGAEPCVIVTAWGKMPPEGQR